MFGSAGRCMVFSAWIKLRSVLIRSDVDIHVFGVVVGVGMSLMVLSAQRYLSWIKFHTQHHLAYRIRFEQGVLPEPGLHHCSRLRSQIGGVERELFQTALADGGRVYLALPTHSECGRDCEMGPGTGGNCLEHDSVRALGAAVRSHRGFYAKILPQTRSLRGRFLEHVGGSASIRRPGWGRLGEWSRF